MTDQTEKEQEKKVLTLSGAKGTLSLKGNAESQARRSLAQPAGRGKSSVAVEVRRRRSAAPASPAAQDQAPPGADESDLHLTADEREARANALRQALVDDEKRRQEEARRRVLEKAAEEERAASAQGEPEPVPLDAETLRQREMEELRQIEEEEQKKKDDERKRLDADLEKQKESTYRADPAYAAPSSDAGRGRQKFGGEDEERARREAAKLALGARRGGGDRRRSGKLTVTQVLNQDYDRDRGPSLAAQKRARQKARIKSMEPAQKITREVILPETITVQELANRMAERSGDVVKALMKMGVMATINQVLDADTAEILIEDFGHKVRRVTDADVEEGIEGQTDTPEELTSRPPVVTIMGHVDHGKTSLLDALRSTDVVSGEAGGITQHIGAYQVTLSSGGQITFLDTPGHAAFTEMRARGANVTDIVVLVVAANDGIMPQTIEAISHAKAAGVPMIVAINKVDLPDANPNKVRQALLQHEVVVEDLGGETLCVEVSAFRKTGLDKLEEIILLQAEMLNIQANPDRPAVGAVVEAKMEQGKGSVATILVQNGTLRIGDIFVVGSEWGRVRALIDDHGRNTTQALPGQPVEVLGLSATPEAGDRFLVVENESKAREVSEYRSRKKREAEAARLAGTKGTIEQLFVQAQNGEKRALSVVIKGDVHGSVEAIAGSFLKIQEENDEIDVRILYSGVGGITESDIVLAKASNALVVGFNVRANAQARLLAERDGVDMRYYSIIYNVIDDVKALMSGLLSPTVREEYLGQAEIRQVFMVSKVGKVAGCMVTAGSVKRGAKVRLLRDDVVIHEGTLKTLKRFKDEVKDVREGMECGMAFEKYDDIREKDVIECFEVVEEARTIA